MWNILQKPLSRSIRCLRWTVTGRSRTHSPATPSPTTAVARASNTDTLTEFTPTSKHTPNTSRWLPRTSWDAASRRLLECRSEKQRVIVCELIYKAFMSGNAIFTLRVDISPKNTISVIICSPHVVPNLYDSSLFFLQNEIFWSIQWKPMCSSIILNPI